MNIQEPSGKSMSLEEAKKILGVKDTSNKQEIKQKWGQLGKKYHPDVNKHPDATKIIQRINEAYQTIAEKKPELKISKEDIRKEYEAMMREFRKKDIPRREKKFIEDPQDLIEKMYATLQSDEITDSQELYDGLQEILDDIEVGRYKQKDITDEQVEAIKRARDQIDDEIELNETIRARANRKAKQMSRTALYSNKELEQLEQMKQQDKIDAKKDLDIWKKNMKKLIPNIKTKQNKALIPITKKINGKKVLTYTALTMSLVLAILLGKYVYDNRTQTYVPKLLTIGGKKRK